MSANLSHRQRPNYLTNIVSVALVLLLLGFFGLTLIHAQQLIRLFKEKVNVLMEIKPTADTLAMEEVENYLVNADFIKVGSVQFTDKNKAAAMMAEQFGKQFIELDLPNPYYDVFTFNVKENYFSTEQLDKIREDLRQFSAVRDVYYQEDFLQIVGRNLNTLSWFALGIGLLFLIIAIVLIHNTIRLALYANRLTIKNMELVGASWEFISRPYLRRSVWHGLGSSVIAIGLLFLFMEYAYGALPELATLRDSTAIGLLFCGLLALGVLISVLSTYFVVNKYLQLRVEELY